MSDFMRLLVFARPLILTFAPPDAVNQSSVMLETLRIVRPTEFVAVPRVYEKFKELIEMSMRESNGFISKTYDWAKEKGYINTVNMMQGERSPFGYNMAKMLVLSRVKKLLGLDRVEQAYFGAAPMSMEV